MKKTELFDHITTPARWRSDALDRAAAEKPKLKSWQAVSAAAVTAAAMIAVAMMPLLFSRNTLPAEVSESSRETVSEGMTVYGSEKEEQLGSVQRMLEDFDYVEIVTLLDLEKTEEQGMPPDVQMVTVRDFGSFKGTRYGAQEMMVFDSNVLSCPLLCTKLSGREYRDYTDGERHELKFGDRIALGFDLDSYTFEDNGRTLVYDGTVISGANETINGRGYYTHQPRATFTCSGYAYLGDAADKDFKDVLGSAMVASDAQETVNEETIRLVQSHYAAKSFYGFHSKEETSCYIMATRDTENGMMVSRKKALYDDSYSFDDVVSQLFVMSIDKFTDNNENDSFEMIGMDKEKEECTLQLGGRTCSVTIDSETDIEVLDMRLVGGKTSYLLINIIDKEHTGTIPKAVGFNFCFDAPDGANSGETEG